MLNFNVMKNGIDMGAKTKSSISEKFKETDSSIRQKGIGKVVLSFLPIIYYPISLTVGGLYAGMGSVAMVAGAVQRTAGALTGNDQWKEDGKNKIWGGARMIGCGLFAPVFLPTNLFFDGMYNILSGKNSNYSIVSFAEHSYKMLRNKDTSLHLGNTVVNPTQFEKISHSLQVVASQYQGLNDVIFGTCRRFNPFNDKQTRKSGRALAKAGYDALYADYSSQEPKPAPSKQKNSNIREFDTSNNIEQQLYKVVKGTHQAAMHVAKLKKSRDSKNNTADTIEILPRQ